MNSWLVMQATDGAERHFPIGKARIVIGRETTCDVRVPVPSVGHKHCEIINENGTLRLNDLGSVRGTFHNGNRVSEAVLAHADRLEIGPVTFVVRVQHDGDHAGSPPEIVIERLDNNGNIPPRA